MSSARRNRPIPARCTGESIRQEWAKESRALQRETRQRFMGHIHDGKTIGEAQRLCGITFEAALGTLNDNIEQRTTLQFRDEVL